MGKMHEIAFNIAAAIDGRFNAAFVTAAEKMTAMGAKVKQLKGSMNDIDKMYSMGALTASEYGKALAKVGAEIERNEKLQKRMAATQKLQDNAGKVGDKARTGMAVSATVGASLLIPAQKAMSFETEMAGVAKQVDGARDAQGKLSDIGKLAQSDIMDLSKSLMVAPDDIAKAYAFAARAGVKGTENLRKMTELGIMMGTSFEMPREQVTQDMVEIGNAMGYNLGTKEGIASLQAMADRINYVDDQTVAKGQDLIDWMKRSTGIVKGLAGTMTESFQLGLGAGFLSVGVKAEQAETAVKNMLTKFAAAPRESKDFQWALSQIGLSADELQQGMIKNADETVLGVFDRLLTLDEASRLNVMSELFGKEHIGTLSRLASNMDTFTNSIKTANSEAAKGSMRKEFELMSATTARMWEGAQASLTRMMIDLGGALLPSIQEKATALGSFAEKIGSFAKAHPELTSNVMTGTLALAGWGMALSTATWIISSAVGPIISFVKWMFLSQVATDGTIISSKAHVIAEYARAVALKVGAAAQWLWNAAMAVGGKLLTFGKIFIMTAASYAAAVATGAWTAAQWLWNAAMSANPIGLLIIGIAALVAAGIWMYNNWDKVREFMTTLWDSPAFAVIAFVSGPIGWAIAAGVGLIANWEAVKSWFTLLWDDPTAALTAFADMIMGKFGTALAWIEEKWTNLKNLFSGGLGGGLAIGGGGVDIASNAAGGIYGQGAFLTSFAEDSAEAAIPLDGSSRAIGLWQQAGQALGVSGGGGGGGSGGVSAGGGGGSVFNITFAPTINGGGDAGEIGQMLKQERDAFMDQFQSFARQERRLSYE